MSYTILLDILNKILESGVCNGSLRKRRELDSLVDAIEGIPFELGHRCSDKVHHRKLQRLEVGVKNTLDCATSETHQ